MIDPDSVTHTPRQIACDLAYAAFAVWATLWVFDLASANADLLFAWTKVFPGLLAPWVAMAAALLYLVLLMAMPIAWAILWPRRFMPSSLAVFGAFLIFNGYMVFSAIR